MMSNEQKDNNRRINMVLNIVIIVLSIILIATSVYAYINKNTRKDMVDSDSNYKEIESKYPVATVDVKNCGKFKIELYDDIASDTVKNFIILANNGFYDGLTFHRIVDDFIIQGGDPNGDGTGHAMVSDLNKNIKKGSEKDFSYSIKGEFSKNGFENNLKFEKGIVGMARADYGAYGLYKEGYNSASSQFFIVTTDDEKKMQRLDGEYAVFGKVIEGYDVVEKISNADVIDDKPEQEIKIESIKVDTKNKEYEYPYTINFEKINEEVDKYKETYENFYSSYSDNIEQQNSSNENKNNEEDSHYDNSSESSSNENLVDIIHKKYPETNKDGIICYDNYNNYWMLDEEGKKVYFNDLESFEKVYSKYKYLHVK
ncbi:MAG: peptidylprolyl isomerase [Clostridia bacterium]|nr:peptidylprolyl isomerase [Clostridia bacterium]